MHVPIIDYEVLILLLQYILSSRYTSDRQHLWGEPHMTRRSGKNQNKYEYEPIGPTYIHGTTITIILFSLSGRV
jgi:hypothetical protein